MLLRHVERLTSDSRTLYESSSVVPVACSLGWRSRYHIDLELVDDSTLLSRIERDESADRHRDINTSKGLCSGPKEHQSFIESSSLAIHRINWRHR